MTWRSPVIRWCWLLVPFLRDQFFLQDSSTREVQISMTQEAEVGQRLLLSCYTGTLELPELELVNYLTVASFLQMGHVVEQCTQALKKFHPATTLPSETAASGGGRRWRDSQSLSHPENTGAAPSSVNTIVRRRMMKMMM
ncbi:hypothetical protein J4Q44_G00163040 [Coregonus suidteri]|uniref:BTB domain-containing protein n=1 Tax=Coregonus suidteri TaxID=861788 RepID=A0AAN8LR91_9TELE